MRPKLNESFLENRYARADRRERRLHPLSEFPGAIVLALRAAVDPAVRCRDGEAGFSARFVPPHRRRGAGLLERHLRGHERRHRNDHREAAANSRRIRVEVHRLMVKRKEDLPWVGSRTRPLS
jgi:hypothetical protein